MLLLLLLLLLVLLDLLLLLLLLLLKKSLWMLAADAQRQWCIGSRLMYGPRGRACLGHVRRE